MKTSALLSRAILMISAAAAIALPGCGAREKSDAGAESSSAFTVPVQTAPVHLQRLTALKTYSGPLEGEEQAGIIARTSERVTAIKAHVGDAVTTGAVIVMLDKSGATSQFYQAEASYRNAEKTLERMKSLFTEGAISQQALDGAQTAFDVSKANFDAARSIVELTTPIPGNVTAVNVTEGDLTGPGQTLATVASIGRMKVTFNINETDVTSLAIGQSVEVYSETRPDVRVEGNITQLSKSADSRSRSFEIKATFPNTRDRWFKPGMFCKVIIHVSSSQEVLTVPNGAVQSDGVTDRVFVVHDGRAFLRTVRLGITDGQSVAVLEGLTGSDTVATVGANSLKDSSDVTIVNR
jgi:membrane fusion protein, multidrug efflux system